VIGSSHPLAYCTIFIIMFSEVVDLHIYICIRISHCLYLRKHTLHTAATLLQPAVPPPICWPSFLTMLTCLHLFAIVWWEVMWLLMCSISQHFQQKLLNKDQQCCESRRDVELGVHAVCAVGDTTDEDRWVDLLCCSPHYVTAESCLTNDTLPTFSSSSDCYDDWRRPSLTVRHRSYDASSPFLRCHLLRSCHNVSAAQRLLQATSCIFLMTFSVFYYVTDSFFPVVPLSISLHTILSHNHHITPVIEVIFWFQSCLLIISSSVHWP